ncbi:hypothetical protein ES708_06125 [subsurface metagenome]
MTVDIQQSLLNHLWSLLTTNEDVRRAMDRTTYLLYHTWADPDAIFPYMVHRIDMGILGDWSPEAMCTYYLDIWSHSKEVTEILAIRKLIMELLDNIEFSTTETTEVHIWIQTDGFVPEVEQGIWHYACQFNLKWLKDAQIGQILKR